MKSTELQTQLKTLARELDVSYRQVVFCFFAEDFLRRCGKSAKNGNLSLRGGLLTYAYTGMIARSFGKIELCGNDPSLMQTVTEILRVRSEGGVTASDITALSENEVQYTARLGELCLPIRVVREPAELPPQALYELPVLLDGFSAPVVALPEIEHEVCRRLIGLTWELPLTGRADALFDLYFWSVQFNFTGEELLPVLQEHLTKSKLSSAVLKSTFALWKDPSLERRWRAFVKDAGLRPDFRTALGRVAKFLRPVWEAAAENSTLEKDWDAHAGRWEERSYLY